MNSASRNHQLLLVSVPPKGTSLLPQQKTLITPPQNSSWYYHCHLLSTLQMVLGVETGQQTPPNSPATPVDVSCDRMTAGEGRSFEVEQLLSVGSDNAANFAKGSSGSEHLQQHQDLELIRQQMLVNEFTRFTGYPADQAANLLCHFGWDYQVGYYFFWNPGVQNSIVRYNLRKCDSLSLRNAYIFTIEAEGIRY